MTRFLPITLAIGALVATPVFAECGIAAGSVRILSNDFNSLRDVVGAAMECASPTVTITKNQTTKHADLQGPALTADPAEYTVAVISIDTLSSLLSQGLIRPLDELVAKYGKTLKPNQLIKVDGKVVAVAFMANSQNFVYRADILEKAGVPVPTTYEDVLTAAAAIRDKGIMKYPLAGAYLPDWDLAEEFVNLYFGYGGDLFEPGTAKAAIDNDKGVKALGMMKSLSAFMNPDYLTYDSDVVAPIWEAGDIAMTNLWGSRAGTFVSDPDAQTDVGKATRLAATPTVGGGTVPASTVWWDGFTIAKNISDQDADASFQAMMHGISLEMATAHPTDAVWLINGFKPTPAAAGILGNVSGGAKSYPMDPYMGYLHTAIGQNIAAYLQGKESAEQALSDATTAYTTAATEAGYLK